MKPINSHRKESPKFSVVPKKRKKNQTEKKVPCFHFRRFPCRICVENYGVGELVKVQRKKKKSGKYERLCYKDYAYSIALKQLPKKKPMKNHGIKKAHSKEL